MRIYLASPTTTGHTAPCWRDIVNIYLASPFSRGEVVEELKSQGNDNMKIFMAGEHPVKNGNLANWENIYILESFYYCRGNKWIPILIKKHFRPGYFMLDSGAFTFMENAKIIVDWDRYVSEYAEFITNNNIDLFLELDIDSVVGIKKVEQLRYKLERKTGKKCIPVWHKSRGLQYWKDMVQEYSYVAIGGIVSKEITCRDYKYFIPLLDMAQKQGTRVHGLGFTNLEGLRKYPFYSVDSTAWLYGNRGGYLYKFDGKTMVKVDKPPGMKLRSREAAIHNFNEWIKFQRYAEKNL